MDICANHPNEAPLLSPARSQPSLPLSRGGAQVCRRALKALGGAGARGPGPLPPAFILALRLLEDPALAEFRGRARPPVRAARRALLRDLRDRHPEALGAIQEVLGVRPGAPDTVVTNVFTWLVVWTIGTDGWPDHPLADLATL
jgi:hypothetical protein